MDPNQTGRSSSTKKWLIGCGIGCGAILVIAALLVTGAFFFVRNLVEGFKDSEALLETLTERYGRITEFCPQPEGALPADRIAAFLKAREATDEVRDKIARSITLLEDEGGEIDVETKGNVFQKLKMVFGLIPQVADFFKARNQALLDVEMGMGEYYYIYAIAYFSWLKKPLADGTSLSFTEGDEEFRIQDWDKEESSEVRMDIALRRFRRMLLPMLRNQYEKLQEGSFSDVSREWKLALADEIEAMDSDRYRMVWQDGLPSVISDSLEPFREALEASYNSILNTIEISLEQR